MHDRKPDAFWKALVKARGERLTARAEAKYGPTATSPRGDESRDIFDYCLNELAGLPRYAEMMAARVASNDLLFPHQQERGHYIFKRIAEDGAHFAFLLERYRAELLSDGHDLGAAEDI